MKTIITLECLNRPNPGDLGHIISLLQNPNNRNHIKIEFDETEK